MSEEGLLDRARGGDADALEELLGRYGPQVRRVVSGTIPDRWQSLLSADDVMQQTYMDAFLGIGGFQSQGPGSFLAWLSTLARTNVSDAVRMLGAEKRGGNRRRVEPRTGKDDSLMDLYELANATLSTPSRHAARGEAGAAIERGVEALPDAYRKVVRLYDLEGRPVEEVAEALKRSVGAVYMLRARAHDRLRQIMGTPSMYFSDTA